MNWGVKPQENENEKGGSVFAIAVWSMGFLQIFFLLLFRKFTGKGFPIANTQTLA